MARRPKVAVAAFAALLGFSGPVSAQTITDGNSLLQRCSVLHVVNPMAGLHCRGYIGAIVDIMADGHEVAGFRACPTHPREREKIIKAVKAWLETHKSELGVNAYVVSARALAEAYPCSEDGPTAPKP